MGCDWYLPRIGGLELQMRDLARELNARGHETHVITATPAARDGGAAARVGALEDDRSPVHRLAVPLLPKLAVIRSRRALEPLAAVLERERFDVLHCHTALSPLAHAGAWLGRARGIPTLLTEHSVLKGAGAWALAAAHRRYHWGEWPTLLSAVSGYVARELSQVTGRSDVEVLPNGVDPTEWTGAPSDSDHSDDTAGESERDGVVRIVATMRLTKRKRPIDVVRAVPRVNAALGGAPRPIFQLIGGGPEHERVIREAARLGVTDQIEILGWRPREEVKRLYRRASLFALPTSKEALSIASLEALAAGLPVVAMDHGGIGDIVENGREGFLAADFDEWVARIAELVRDAPLREKLSAATRASAARFSWDAVIARHLQLYRAAIARPVA